MGKLRFDPKKDLRNEFFEKTINHNVKRQSTNFVLRCLKKGQTNHDKSFFLERARADSIIRGF